MKIPKIFKMLRKGKMTRELMTNSIRLFICQGKVSGIRVRGTHHHDVFQLRMHP